jgi:SAM-dependent methyltransferase
MVIKMLNRTNDLPAEQQLLQYLLDSLEVHAFERLTLSKYQGDIADLEKIMIRPVQIKQQSMLSCVYRYKTKDITKNFSPEQIVLEIQQQLQDGFKHANLKTTHDEYQLMISKKGQASLNHQKINPVAQPATSQTARQSPSSSQAASISIAAEQQHNRSKQRYVDQAQPFLQALGVTDKAGQIIPAMSRKWKQINKFVEIFSGALQQANIEQQDTINVVDFGSGKGYLTFAVYDYIQQQLHKTAQVTGVELRDELVQFCNQVTTQVNADGMQFYQGDVRSFQPEAVDVMIALHACDVATDYALHTGIRLNASIIMCAPCCHKQIRPQLQMPKVLKPMLQYGVHLGQEAEMLTDSLRALLLEAHGYDTKVFEFVALEHTSKNKMILAIKKAKSAQKQAEILQQIEEIKQFYGVKEHCLEELLKA